MPKDSLSEEEFQALSASLDRTRQAVKTTVLTRYEACVVEWLLDISPGRKELRGRFEHGISNATDDTLAMAGRLVREIVQVIAENNEEGLRHVEAVFKHSFELDGEYKRVIRAHALLESALRQEELGQHPEQVPLFCFQAGPFDARFRELDADAAHEVLRRVKLDDSTKGGAGNLNVTGALAKLMVQCGAFDCGLAKSERENLDRAKDKIKNAFKKTKKAPASGPDLV